MLAHAESAQESVYTPVVPTVGGSKESTPKSSTGKSATHNKTSNNAQAHSSAAEGGSAENSVEPEEEGSGNGQKSSGGGGGTGGSGGNHPSTGGGEGISNRQAVAHEGPGANVSESSGGSSPVVPILIAVVVLAAISIGVVLYRQRKSGPGPDSRVSSPNAS